MAVRKRKIGKIGKFAWSAARKPGDFWLWETTLHTGFANTMLEAWSAARSYVERELSGEGGCYYVWKPGVPGSRSERSGEFGKDGCWVEEGKNGNKRFFPSEKERAYLESRRN
jgi:hypothetical protein